MRIIFDFARVIATCAVQYMPGVSFDTIMSADDNDTIMLAESFVEGRGAMRGGLHRGKAVRSGRRLTFKRRQSLRSCPIWPCSLERTIEMMQQSKSCPWHLSTVKAGTSTAAAGRRWDTALSWALYGAMSAICAGNARREYGGLRVFT